MFQVRSHDGQSGGHGRHTGWSRLELSRLCRRSRPPTRIAYTSAVPDVGPRAGQCLSVSDGRWTLPGRVLGRRDTTDALADESTIRERGSRHVLHISLLLWLIALRSANFQFLAFEASTSELFPCSPPACRSRLTSHASARDSPRCRNGSTCCAKRALCTVSNEWRRGPTCLLHRRSSWCDACSRRQRSVIRRQQQQHRHDHSQHRHQRIHICSRTQRRRLRSVSALQRASTQR